MRTQFLLATFLVIVGAVASTARADGLPLLGQGVGPLAIEAGPERLVSLPSARGTVLLRIQRDGGQVFASRFLARQLTIPQVAYDGSTGGLSADGKTLVLLHPRVSFPQARTTFVFLNAKTLRVRAETTLKGDFSFDAISPDGSTLYFINYISPTDPTRYAVRAFDVASGKLIPEPIVDKTEPDEDMHGNPITRATSPNGRWAYTLYDGGGTKPFVHALDTVGMQARCIDLDALAGNKNLSNMRLRLGDGTLTVTSGSKAVLAVDTATFRVSEPVATSGGDDGVSPWIPVGGVGLATLLALGALSLFVRRRRLATT
jgi:hypothetical protein